MCESGWGRMFLWLISGALILATNQAGRGAAPFIPSGKLTPNRQKQIDQLKSRLQNAAEAGKMDQALRLAREVKELRQAWQGKKHWETVDAGFVVERYGRLARLMESRWLAVGRVIRFNRAGAKLVAGGKYAHAQPHLENALTICHEVFGEEDAETAVTCGNLAACLSAQGKHTAARPYYETALAISRKSLGKGHPNTGFAHMALAGSLHLQGKHAEAQSHYEQAVAIKVATLGKNHPDTAVAFNHLASSLHAQGKYAQALPLYEQALAIDRKVLGEHHQRIVVSYSNLAYNLHKLRRYAEATVYCEKALAISLATLGREHPSTAASFTNLAINLQVDGKRDRATPLFEQAWWINRKALGEEHPTTIASLVTLAADLRDRGRHARAEPLFEKLLAVRLKTLGPEHPDTAAGFTDFAMNLHFQGKYERAMPLYENALKINRSVLGEKHPRAVTSIGRLAVNLRDQGKYAEAEPLFARALAIRLDVLGEDHPLTAVSYSNLAVNHDRQGKHAQAQLLFEKALAINRRRLGDRHQNTVIVYSNLASNLAAQGKRAEAESLFEKAVAMSRDVLGEGHPNTAMVYNNMALNLSKQGKHARAEPAFVKATELIRKWCGEEHPAIAAATNNRAVNLYARGKYEEARPLFEKALSLSRRKLGEEHPHTADCCIWVAMNAWKQARQREAVLLLQASLPGHEAARFQRATSGFDRAIAARHFSPHALLALGLAHLGQPGNAFRHAEANLSRGLLDDVHPATTPDEARQVSDLNARRETLDRQLLSAFRQTDLSAEQEEMRDGLMRERRRILSRLVHIAAHISSRQVFPVGEIQKQLPRDGALVLWLDIDSLGEHRACILRTTGEPFWVRLPGSSEDSSWTAQDQALAGNLYNLLKKPDTNANERDRECNALRKQRLDPLRPYLAAANDLPAVRRLLVVPTGWAGAVPLETLGTEHVISYVPSGSVHARLARDHRTVAASSLLALGDPLFAPAGGRGPGALPGTRWEVQALARLVPKTTTLLGSGASEQRLHEMARKDQLKAYRLIHLATHALVDWQTPGHSRLLLARDRLVDSVKQVEIGQKVFTGELTVDAIRADWKLDADLVVLSACKTAVGKDGRGDGPLGFAQAFLQRGARSVVLSRWEADDTATALLMLRFYENVLGKRAGLKTPLARAEALAEAKKWLRELTRKETLHLVAALGTGKLSSTARGSIVDLDLDPTRVKVPGGERPYAHPFFWAAFTLIGDPD
jgi:CHAT domain-containing protein/Tfp pilus assembly protein PilF